jgi:ABC-type sulfate/molybdate transport systems ATPase subunit
VRLAFARCLYRNPDLFLLDDPLSALDLHVGSFLMEDTICGQLKDTTRIVITHAVEFARFADRVIIMDDGKIIKDGTYSEVSTDPYFDNLKQRVSDKQKPAEKKDEIEVEQKLVDQMRRLRKMSPSEASVLEVDPATLQAERLFFTEDRETGKIDCRVFNGIIKKLGGIHWFIFLYLLTQSFVVASAFANKTMLEWSKDFQDPSNNEYNTIFLIIVFLGRNFLAGLMA